MAGDYNLYAKGCTNLSTVTSVSHVTIGSVTIATADMVTGSDIKSTEAGSVYAAYKDLWERVNDGQTGLIPSLTTTEIAALSGIDDGVQVINKTLGRLDVCTGSAFVSAAGAGIMKPAAYGSMYENNSSGSAMNSSTKQWITASAGKFDSNSLITFLNHADGDRIVVGTGGAGDYIIIASCGQTNGGNNQSIMTVHKNGTDLTELQDDQNSNTTFHRPLVANGILTLADNDYLTLHIVSATPADIIKVHNCHLTIQRTS